MYAKNKGAGRGYYSEGHCTAFKVSIAKKKIRKWSALTREAHAQGKGVLNPVDGPINAEKKTPLLPFNTRDLWKYCLCMPLRYLYSYVNTPTPIAVLKYYIVDTSFEYRHTIQSKR